MTNCGNITNRNPCSNTNSKCIRSTNNTNAIVVELVASMLQLCILQIGSYYIFKCVGINPTCHNTNNGSGNDDWIKGRLEKMLTNTNTKETTLQTETCFKGFFQMDLIHDACFFATHH